ncbi:hypothetical protein I315_02267 [Cryptococcus gattii Ru294]|nr:hypothetical protein I315_02267 [Cryptococcus gattii Ru294]
MFMVITTAGDEETPPPSPSVKRKRKSKRWRTRPGGGLIDGIFFLQPRSPPDYQSSDECHGGPVPDHMSTGGYTKSHERQRCKSASLYYYSERAQSADKENGSCV